MPLFKSYSYFFYTPAILFFSLTRTILNKNSIEKTSAVIVVILSKFILVKHFQINYCCTDCAAKRSEKK